MVDLVSPASAYVQRFVNSVLGIRGIHVDASLAKTIFRELSRMPEVEMRTRDQWGNWEWPFAESQREGKLYRPWLDEPLAELRHCLMQEYPEWPWEPLWPDGRSFALCLTHDVDIVSQHATGWAFLRSFYRMRQAQERKKEQAKRLIWTGISAVSGWIRNSKDPLWHYEDWLSLEDRFGFRSTFFFFPSHLIKPAVWDANYHFDDEIIFAKRPMTVSQMMQVIHRAGWEIGLHGSYYSATETGILRCEREQIETVIEDTVISIRQHWLHYDITRTPRLQVEAELRCDSTQGFNRSIGFRAGTSFPYWCWDHRTQSALPILEIPLHVMDGALFTTNALEYDAELAVHHCIQLMDRVAQVGGCLTLNWHPNYLNDSKWWSVYQALLEEGARRNAWGCTAGQLYAWWIQRESRLQWAPSHGIGAMP
ncbi:MAG: polysaccharide deacetylase family protein [Roseiflexaceae bacterium]|nr:polysaccharide deacetylase family protein [Roseiflexaceae bacterium]